MAENHTNPLSANDTNRQRLMDEFVKVCIASSEYMAEHLEMRLWDAGEAAHQLEQYLRDRQASAETTSKLKP